MTDTVVKSDENQKAVVQTLVDAISSLHGNVYAALIIAAGVVLQVRGFQAQGTALISGGFVLLNSDSKVVK